MESFIEWIDLINDLARLNKFYEVSFDLVNWHVEFFWNFSDRDNFVSLNVLLKSFEPDVSEDRNIFVLAKVHIVFEVVFDGFQGLMEFQVISI